MSTISTMLHVDALKRDLGRLVNCDDSVTKERILARMVDTVEDALGVPGDLVNEVVVKITKLNVDQDDLVDRIANILKGES